MATTPDPKDIQRLAELYKKIQGYSQATAQAAAQFAANNGTAASELARLEKSFNKLKENAIDFHDSIKKTLQDIKELNTNISQSTIRFDKINDITHRLYLDKKEISKLSKTDLISLQSQLQAEAKKVKTINEQLKAEASVLNDKKKITGLTTEENDKLKEIGQNIRNNIKFLEGEKNQGKEIESTYSQINKLISERLAKEKQIEKAMGLSGAIVKSLKKILPSPIAEALKLDEALIKMRAVAEDGGSRFKVMMTGFKAMGKGLFETLTDPLTSIMLIVKLFKEFLNIGFAADKRIVDLGKGLAISKEEARDLNTRFGEITRETGNSANEAERLLVNQQRLAESTFQLGKAFGATRGFTEAQLKDQIILTKLYGLQEEEVAGLQQLAMANGMTADQVLKSTIKQTSALAKQTGIQLDNKKVLGEVAKVSGQLRLQYQNNPALIAQAVVQTEKLGINLEKAKNMANSLLQFEDSISAELEAELLTGKQINLEEARLLALNGKTAEAASKVAEQIGSSAEFSRMNVLQQDAFAKALGMNSDELANMLLYNENINNLGANTKKQIEEQIALAKQRGEMDKVRMLENSIGNEEAAKKALEEIDAQTKFNEILEKGKAILASFIEGPASQFVEMLSNVGNLTDRIVGTVKAIGIAFGAIKLSGFLGQLASIAATTGVAAAGALTWAAGITLAIGIGAVLVAIGQAMGAFNSNKTEAAKVPAYKDGGLVANSGIALVGEEGPELVTLPAGANVTTARETKDILNSKLESQTAAENKNPKSEPQTIVKGGETSLTIDGTTFARLITPFVMTELDKRNTKVQ